MLSPRTEKKLADGLLILAVEQAVGAAPPDGEVTRADIARRAGVSETTILNIERLFQARLANAILEDPKAPRHLTRFARAIIENL